MSYSLHQPHVQLSEGHPICAVCGRGDLDTGYPEIRGCYDTKVTSWRMALDLEAEAVNGPTRGPGDLPMFMWETAPAPDGQLPLHLGQPRLFDFQFERMSPDPLAEAAGDGCAEVDGGGESGLAALASWRWW